MLLQVARARVGSLAAVVLAACAPGEIASVARGAAGGVERPGLRVEVHVDPADSALARDLDWLTGVPGARAHLNRVGTAEWTVATTQGAGIVPFTGAVAGVYRLFAQRLVVGVEADAVGVPALALGDGAGPTVGTGTVQRLALNAHRPAGILISEIGDGSALPWETNGSYAAHMYFEVQNAGETTVYLDGVLFTWPGSAYLPTVSRSCADIEVLRLDTLGVYALGILRFPGSGAEYPIAAGQVKVVVAAAIDHRPVHPTLPDMRHADFEFGCDGCADNPAVPNMLDVGPGRWRPQFLFTGRNVYTLTRPLEVSTLPRPQPGLTDAYRVPAEALLDVVAFDSVWPEQDLELPPCQPMLDRRFDRYPGGFKLIGTGDPQAALVSVQRRVLRIDAEGRNVLFNTNTSAVDFYRGPRTPGWLPEVGEGW